MATLAQTIIDAAVKSSLLNDAQRTKVASDETEVLNVLNRLVQRIYGVLAMPVEKGGASRGDFFATSATVTISAASPPSVPAAAFRHEWQNAGGAPVAVVTRKDLVAGRAELPPAILIEQDKVRSAGRAGDPVDNDVLTARYTPLPGTLTDADLHYVGATTPATASTTQWPDHVGNPWLVAELRRYFAVKRGVPVDDAEWQNVTEEVQRSAQTLAAFVGIDGTYLVSLRDA